MKVPLGGRQSTVSLTAALEVLNKLARFQEGGEWHGSGFTRRADDVHIPSQYPCAQLLLLPVPGARRRRLSTSVSKI